MIQETGTNQHRSLYIYTDQSSYEPLARIDKRGNDPERVMYFHTDLNGCPEELTDENGKILWECSFQLWGKRIHEIEHEPIEQNLRYQGQYLDRETGLHYNTFRYYDPDIGRFTQPDPIGLAGGLNLYQYAPNGLTWVDPTGLSKCGPNKSTKQGYHKETYDPKPVKPENAVYRWEEFLGAGPYSNKHPRTGLPDHDRIVSADGKRSIRYGNHEMNSKPTKHHYHEETWTYDPVKDIMNVDNTVIRVPLQK
jgi:RHS repeat-associated protein